MQTIENFTATVGGVPIPLQLAYEVYHPLQAGIASEVPPGFQITVQRGDDFGLEQDDVVFALVLMLDQLKITRRRERLGRSQADA